MKAHAVRVALLAAVSVATLGLAFAQDPASAAPAPAAPVALSEELPVPDAPAVTGTAWVLMDHATGQVLAGENVDERVEPASITKVMTSYVIAAEMAAGKIDNDDDVMMTVNAWRSGGAGTDGSYSGFEVNKTAKLIEMEKGMTVQSGNDAAIALAEHIAGSEDAFASLMNAYAARIGMETTNFVNSHGLSEPEHYSTARDLALLGRALARDYPDHYAYNKIKEFKVGQMDPQMNRNVLLWRDPSVDGIKTGHHSGAGYCLMASAKRGDQRLISVVMGSTSESQRATDSQALLNWGFRFFETHELYAADEPVATQKIWKGQANEIGLGVAQPLLVSMHRGQYSKLQPSMDVPRTLVAPLEHGQAVGTVRVMLDGKLVAQAPLVALEEVPEAGFFKRLWHELLMWWQSV